MFYRTKALSRFILRKCGVEPALNYKEWPMTPSLKEWPMTPSLTCDDCSQAMWAAPVCRGSWETQEPLRADAQWSDGTWDSHWEENLNSNHCQVRGAKSTWVKVQLTCLKSTCVKEVVEIKLQFNVLTSSVQQANIVAAQHSTWIRQAAIAVLTMSAIQIIFTYKYLPCGRMCNISTFRLIL